MNGEALRDYVRYRVADHQLDNYVNGQRALRRYCQTARFPWLKDVSGALIKFQAGKAEYPLGEIGLRAITQVWVQNSDGEWCPLDPLEERGFEKTVNDQIENTSTSTVTPSGYMLYGPGLLTLKIAPTPSSDFEGRISGTANAPVIERLTELPGPTDYHEVIGDLWAGMEMQHKALTMLLTADSEVALAAATTIRTTGQTMENDAMSRIASVVSDSIGQQRDSLKAPKQRLMR